MRVAQVWWGTCIGQSTMADQVAVADAVKDGGAVKATVPLMTLVMAMVVAVALAVGGLGGVMWWMAKSGRLGFPAGAAGPAKVEPVKVEAAKTKLVALEPLLVNLADEGGKSYLRVGMTLEIEDPPPVKGEKAKEPEKGKPTNEHEAAERDAALGVIGRQTADGLLGADGKERLKRELKAAMAEHIHEVKVADVLFTEFLVQR